MTTKHTPGPWGIDAVPSSDVHYIRSVTDADGRAIAKVRHHLEQTMDEAITNARLIAAAPDMLAALRAAHSDIQRIPGHTIDMLGRIEAAIAKAEGWS